MLTAWFSLYQMSANAEQTKLRQVLPLDARYQHAFVPDCHDPSLDDSQWPLMLLRELAEQRHYCLRVWLDVDPALDPLRTQLSVYMLASATLYWDGEHVADKGHPAQALDNEIPGPVAVHVDLTPQQLQPGRHLLSMQVSSYHHLQDMHSIFYALLLQDTRYLDQQQAVGLILPQLLMGSMLLLGVVFLLVYWRYQHDPAFLSFALLCLCAGTLIGWELVKFYLAYPWHWHLYRLWLILLVTLLTAVLMLQYYLHFYRMTLARACGWLVAASLLGTVVLVKSYDGKSLLIFTLIWLASLWINVQAWRQQLPWAKVNTLVLAGGLLLLVLLPFQFIEQWFALVYSVIAMANLYGLMLRFGEDREKALTAVKLEAEMLRRNVQPHFVMNSLTLLVEWVETQPKLAVQFIEALADEFRLINTLSKQQLVPLHQELALCHKHVTIMAWRYQIEVKWVVTGEVGELCLPPAILHTLVENAFSHSKFQDGDRIEVSVQQQNGQLTIVLSSPLRRRDHLGTGTGESYIRSRLSERFGQHWHFSSHARESRWVNTLQFPALHLEDVECVSP